MKPYYSQDGITIYHGDCREVMDAVNLSADLLLTDPPYGIGASRRSGFGNGVTGTYKTGFLAGKTRIGTKTYKEGSWDDKPADAETLNAARALCKHQIIFGGNYFELPPARCWLLWDKVNGNTDFADAEMAWTNLDSAVRLIRYLWNGMMKERPEVRFHPTQKPLAVMKWCIGKAPDNIQSVFDPYAGSGTTLVAAKECGLQAIGIEQDEHYCAIIAKRLAQGVLTYAKEAPCA